MPRFQQHWSCPCCRPCRAAAHPGQRGRPAGPLCHQPGRQHQPAGPQAPGVYGWAREGKTAHGSGSCPAGPRVLNCKTTWGPTDLNTTCAPSNPPPPPPPRQTVDPRLWNLDRLDQRDLPLDGAYTYGSGGVPGAGGGGAQRRGGGFCFMSKCAEPRAHRPNRPANCGPGTRQSPRCPSVHAWASSPVHRRLPSPLDAATTVGTGRGATIYVVDSGVRASHQEFRTQDGSRTRAFHGAHGGRSLQC